MKINKSESDVKVIVEKTIKKLDYYPTKSELLKALPKQIPHHELSLILQNLENSNKIIFFENEIIWSSVNNERIKKLVKTAISI